MNSKMTMIEAETKLAEMFPETLFLIHFNLSRSSFGGARSVSFGISVFSNRKPDINVKGPTLEYVMAQVMAQVDPPPNDAEIDAAFVGV